MNPWIHAARYALAATSMEQGRLASCHMFQHTHEAAKTLFPFGIYTIPEISMVGQTEQALTAANTPYEVGLARYREIARGQLIADPHGLCIINDVIYLTDRNDHVALKYTLDGKPLMILGARGQPSDTGATKDIELPPRSAGPFNKPTEMMVAPSVASRARVPCSTRGGSRAKKRPESFICPTACGSIVRTTSMSATARTVGSRSSRRPGSSSPSGGTSTNRPTSISTLRRSPT